MFLCITFPVGSHWNSVWCHYNGSEMTRFTFNNWIVGFFLLIWVSSLSWTGSNLLNLFRNEIERLVIVFADSSTTTDEDSLRAELRHRTTIPWSSFATYLRGAGLLLLLLLVLSQLTKHSLMVAIDFWLAHWTSQVIAAQMESVERNCTVTQVCNI